MSITFRPTRSTLAESMAEAVTVPDRAALLAHLRTMHPTIGPAFDASRIEITPYRGGWPTGDDDRIGWKDVHIVELNGHSGVLGFCTFKPVEAVTR